MISKVYLRKKKISKGKVSLYLDFYPPILIPGTNRTTRRYFLNVHLPEKPKSFAKCIKRELDEFVKEKPLVQVLIDRSFLSEELKK